MLNDPRLRALFGEFLRFAAVGLVGTVVHYSILISLVELAHAPLVPATSTGFIFASVVSYTLNRRITFKHQPDFGSGLFKFVAIGAVGLCLNAVIVAVLAHRMGVLYILAQMVATATILVWNFVTARLVVFRSRPSAS